MPELIAGLYEVQERLGSGAAADVYRVRDQRDGSVCALKLLRPDGVADPGALARALHREFETLVHLRHPHLVRVLDFGTAPAPTDKELPPRPGADPSPVLSRPWFTMDLVPGRHAAEALGHPVDWTRLARLADAVLDALSALHHAGLVHRDVTASNILAGDDLDHDPPPVWLMDLGLIDRVRPAGAESISGTPATMAPETIRGGAIDGRADLYSMGCVLYRLATGQDPFTGSSLWDILRGHLSLSPTPPRLLNPEIPASLEHLVLALLAKNPADRPATADVAREALAALSGRTAGRAAPLPRALQPVLAGRERELAVVGEALQGPAEGRVLLVTGPVGIGRSRLLEEARLAARLAGRSSVMICACDVPARPFGLIDAAVAALGGAESTHGGLEARVDELAALLAGRRALLVVDDAGRADALSREVLLRVAARAHEGSLPILLLLSVPDAGGPGGDELTDGLMERGLARVIRLRPLELAATARMAASMLGHSELPPAWPAFLVERTGGLPLLIEALVEALVAGGRVGPGASVPPDPHGLVAEGEAPLSPRSRDWLVRRWQSLGEPERAILAGLATAGSEPLEFGELEALDPHVSVAPAALDGLIEGGLVRRLTATDGRVQLALAAPALAECVLEQVAPAHRRLMHRRRAELLAGRPGYDAVRAAHLDAAGEPAAAIGLMVSAAAAALENGVPREAIRLADRALATLAAAPAAAHEGSIRRLRAAALAALGGAAEAESEFERAIACARTAGDTLQLAQVLYTAGAFRGGRDDPRRALPQLEESLALFDDLGDTAGGAAALLELGRALERAGQTADAEARLSSALSQARRAGRSDLEAGCLLALGELTARQGRADAAGELFRSAESVAVRAGTASARSQARRGNVVALEAAGRLDVALAEAEAWIGDARRAGHLAAEAEASELAAGLLARIGQRAAALRQFDAAAALRRRMGQDGSAAADLARAAAVLLERGQSRAARRRAEEALAIAERVHAPAARGAALRVLARLEAQAGRPREVAALLGPADEAGTPHARAEIALLTGLARLEAGDPAAARESLQEACFIARRAALSDVEDDGLLWLAAAALELREPERARLALRRVRQSAETRGAPELLAAARLLEAELELAAAGGDARTARDEAERAAQVLAERERGDLAWRAFAALETASTRLGDDEAARRAAGETLRRLDAWLAALPDSERAARREQPRIRAVLEREARPAPPARQADEVARDERLARFERLLEINRSLNSTLELRPLMALLLDTAIELTGAERGFVLLEHEGGAAVEAARGEGGTELSGAEREASRGVAREVMRAGEPLLALDALTDARLSASASVHALRLQSILAVPLSVRGQIAGAIVLDARRAPGVFGAEEQRLTSRLADQAGIALANARLVEELRRQSDEIRRLNERLALKVEEQRIELIEKQSNLELRFRFDCLVGASPPMQKLYRTLDKLLPTEIPVLVTGESGTGKDLVARVLHYNGPRKEGRYVALNCAALTETLLESELFGHKRGAFTGADRDRRGLFEQADGGTLFLDEIGELPLHLQPKLLRAIQFGEVRRLGEDTPRRVDVRIVAATNREVTQMVREGSFREDLYYRLDVGRVHLAPLSERLDDLGLLVDHFLTLEAERAGRAARRIEPAALRLFLRYDWPGNVRELQNEVLRLEAFSDGPVITELDVLENCTFLERASARRTTGEASDTGPVTTLETIEVEQIRNALRAAGGNRTRAAEMLGIDRSTLYRKLKRLGEETN